MDAKKYIETLQLEPHPEGGYYRQVYGNDDKGTKDISTIYYMLTGSDFSAFHRLHNMTEIWYYHAGERLNIYVIDPDGSLTVHHLFANNEMQVVIQPGQWFAADIPSKTGFCLVGCAVALPSASRTSSWPTKANCKANFPSMLTSSSDCAGKQGYYNPKIKFIFISKQFIFFCIFAMKI